MTTLFVKRGMRCGMTAAIILGWLAAASAETEKPVPSLDLVPENVAYYSVMLRGREQWDAIVHSRAWARLKAMPVVKMLEGLYAVQTLDQESVPGRIEAALREPKVTKALDLAADMFSHEVFCYGESSVADFLELMQTLMNTSRYGPALAEATGEAKGVEKAEVRKKMMISALVENLSRLKVPEVVMGFRVTNIPLVKEELTELEQHASALLAQHPKTKGRLKKTAVAGHMYLVLSLDGKMLPWDELPKDELESLPLDKADREKLIARFKELKLVLAVGLRGDYLIAAMGPSTDVLTRLGKGKSLGSRPELAPLKKFADKRLTGVEYMSKALNARLAGTRQDVDDLAKTVTEALAEAELPKDALAEIRKDIMALAKDLKPLVAEPGPVMALSFLTESGTESYGYDWGEHTGVDGTKPLGLLQHVGGSPILAAVARSKPSPAGYDLVAKWVGVGYRYVEKYGRPQMEEADRAKFDKFMTQARPLIKRLDEANRKMLLPALADGQIALVLDAKFASKRYLKALPPTKNLLPMLEPAMVFGVSDAALLRKACVEYRAVADGLLEAARGIEGSDIPADFKLPKAKEIKTPAGTLYGYPLPKDWGVDMKVLPNGGLSEHVAVLSISQAHSERLLRATPATVDGRAIPATRPLAGAVLFDFAALIEALTPWVDLAFDKIAENPSATGPVDMASIREQTHTVLDVLKVFRNVTSESYLEGKALVGHTRVELRNVK